MSAINLQIGQSLFVLLLLSTTQSSFILVFKNNAVSLRFVPLYINRKPEMLKSRGKTITNRIILKNIILVGNKTLPTICSKSKSLT